MGRSLLGRYLLAHDVWMYGDLQLSAGKTMMAENTNTDGHRTPQPQLVTIELLRAELAELELRIVDRISALEARLDHKFEKMNGRLWFAFSILAALIVGFGIFG